MPGPESAAEAGHLLGPRPGAGSGRAGSAAILLDGAAGAAQLGGKGATLDRLIAWGLPVPPTGVVVADAYERFASDAAVAELVERIRAGAEVPGEEVDAVFSAAPFDERDAAEIVAVARQVADHRPLAVRSSATVEDLDRSSSAGQYRSVLSVDAGDDDAVLDAVRLVFASLWHPAPRAYRQVFGIDEAAVAMAAVVMRMVPAERAGVVFTADPAGDPTSARVEAVAGLGESLVSGAETPEAFLVPRQGHRVDVAAEVLEALDLALDVERRTGSPQDVEWAWDGDRVWLVQARPITVADDAGDGVDEPIDVGPIQGRQIEGWAASGGRLRGRAQVVSSPVDDLEEGAVLVATATDPSWMPLLLRAGAIVLDRGGLLSHAAILARELGVPAVLNVPGATTLLAGHDITVDGDAGVVTVHDLEDEP